MGLCIVCGAELPTIKGSDGLCKFCLYLLRKRNEFKREVVRPTNRVIICPACARTIYISDESRAVLRKTLLKKIVEIEKMLMRRHVYGMRVLKKRERRDADEAYFSLKREVLGEVQDIYEFLDREVIDYETFGD